MPDVEVASLYQNAVLWVNLNRADKYGQPTYDDPIDIPVKWDDVFTESLDPEGNTIMTSASAVVDRDIVVGSLMWLGDLKDWSDEDGGNLKEVKTISRTTDIKGRVSMRTVGMMRYKGKLPPMPTT